MMNFMRFKWLYFLISGLVLIPGIFSLAFWGLRPAIDFTGGTLLELKFEKAVIEQFSNLAIEQAIREKNFEVSSIQFSGEKTILIRTKPITKDDVSTIKATLAEKFGEMPEELRFETVGPTLGRELLIKTLVAIVI